MVLLNFFFGFKQDEFGFSLYIIHVIKRKEVLRVSKEREVPCKYYVAFGECQNGRQACHKGYCQHCGKYEPRAKVRSMNRKKEALRRAWGEY